MKKKTPTPRYQGSPSYLMSRLSVLPETGLVFSVQSFSLRGGTPIFPPGAEGLSYLFGCG